MGKSQTVVLSTTVTFDQNGIAEINDDEILRVLKEVGEATGNYEIIEDTPKKEAKADKQPKEQKKRGRPRKSASKGKE